MTKAAACLITNSGITVSDLNTTVNCEPRVHDLTLARALGLTNVYEIRRLIRRHLETLEGFGEVSVIRQKPQAISVAGRKTGGRPGTDYWLNKRQALFITAKSDTERAALVTVQMVEVFDAVTGGGAPTTVKVREHRRRLPSPDLREGHGCVMLDGRLVFYRNGAEPRVGDSFLAVRGDGSLVVAVLPEQGPNSFHRVVPRPGIVTIEAPKPWPRGATWAGEQVSVVGVVTSAGGRAVAAVR